MRIFSLKADLAMILYKALTLGAGAKGYNMESLRKVSPIMETLEAGFNAQENKFSNIITTDLKKIFDLKLDEEQFELVKNVIKNSQGWQGSRADRLVLDLADKLKDIPYTDK